MWKEWKSKYEDPYDFDYEAEVDKLIEKFERWEEEDKVWMFWFHVWIISIFVVLLTIVHYADYRYNIPQFYNLG